MSKLMIIKFSKEMGNENWNARDDQRSQDQTERETKLIESEPESKTHYDPVWAAELSLAAVRRRVNHFVFNDIEINYECDV